VALQRVPSISARERLRLGIGVKEEASIQGRVLQWNIGGVFGLF